MLYLYMLTAPVGFGRECYIGLTKHPKARLYGHLQTDGSPRNPKAKWIKRLHSYGLTPIMTILDTVEEAEADAAENDAIAMARAIRGTDCLNFQQRSTYSPAHRRQIRSEDKLPSLQIRWGVSRRLRAAR